MTNQDKALKAVTEIALNGIMALEGRSDLEQKWSDELDFFEVSVWELKKAMLAAYEAGRNSK